MLAKTRHSVEPYELSAAIIRNHKAYLIYRGKELVTVALGRTWEQARKRADKKIREREAGS